MATAVPQHQPTPSLPPNTLNRGLETARAASGSPSATMPSTQQAAPAPPKKGKGKKATDPSEQQKQIQAKIAQLELDAAGDREQEAEIGALCFVSFYEGSFDLEEPRQTVPSPSSLGCRFDHSGTTMSGPRIFMVSRLILTVYRA